MKLRVKPEGRPNIFIPVSKHDLKEFIQIRNLEMIHNFNGGGQIIIGADHEVESVMEDINQAERMAVFTDDSNMRHSLALIINNRLECYDIGEIFESDLSIQPPEAPND